MHIPRAAERISGAISRPGVVRSRCDATAGQTSARGHWQTSTRWQVKPRGHGQTSRHVKPGARRSLQTGTPSRRSTCIYVPHHRLLQLRLRRENSRADFITQRQPLWLGQLWGTGEEAHYIMHTAQQTRPGCLTTPMATMRVPLEEGPHQAATRPAPLKPGLWKVAARGSRGVGGAAVNSPRAAGAPPIREAWAPRAKKERLPV